MDLPTAACHMRRQLQANRLQVVLAPAPQPQFSGHQVRLVEGRNPAWYRELCAEYPSRRSRPRRRGPGYMDTAIKRRHVLRALREIERGGAFASEYARRLMPYVRSCARYLQQQDQLRFLSPFDEIYGDIAMRFS